ncbi:uncharacterized protein F4822DRAFT_434391 [Hypoxylon trugodes]|uniref:uncharacterized protein n=1 Tax=Hypoxylon trugodes TaxID=326681 RepID=UPI00219733E9|nr:uncharacterized protein F4822DRAFT_434391 [Hypoxylon trugodes]KAI1383272.1 hypothetical protein F4822DRAFT_434391 [Hypoxylon trugodes]
MCNYLHFRSRACRHHWLQIYQPCWPGQGFNTCNTFGDGVARQPGELIDAVGPCPACSTHGAYDRHQIRMIMDIRERWRWGMGPSKSDPGSREVKKSTALP